MMVAPVNLDEPAVWDDANADPSACKRLWCAVLGTMVKDAVSLRSVAQLRGRWFETMCDLADMDADALREGVERQIGMRRAA